MKPTIKKIYIAIFAFFALASCKESEGLYFNAETMVYVEKSPDSTIYTFSTQPNTKMQDTIRVDCITMGRSAAVDRKINVVARDTSSAKAGYHYKLLPAVIPANSFRGTIPIVVYRRPGLKDSLLHVVFDIKDNDELKAGYPNRLRYKISLNDKLTKPSIWERVWRPYFGEYSDFKIRFLISATGYTTWNTQPMPGQEAYINGQARYALYQYIQTHGTPPNDGQGNEVVFP